MTLDEITHHLTVWQAHGLAIETQWDALVAITGAAPDSPFGHAIWRAIEDYTNTLAELLGAEPSGTPAFANDLAWYAHENDWGRRGHKADINGEMRVISTPADLAWLITCGKDKS